MSKILDDLIQSQYNYNVAFYIHLKEFNQNVRDELEKLGYTFVSAEIEMVPSTYTKLEDEETATKMQKMLDMFEDNDDIQNVWHNWEMD